MPADGRTRPKLKAWSVLLWLAVWQLGSMAIDSQIILVSPVRVLVRLGELALTGEFWGSIASTVGRITLGFVLGAGTGTLLAALCARYRVMEELMDPVLLTVRSIPVASFIILALILTSSDHLAVLISFLMVMPVLYANVLGGIRAADRQLIEMAQVFRLPPGRMLRYVYVPQVWPYFESACMTGLGMSWKSGVAAEVIGIPTGSIGEKLQQAKVYLDTPDLYAWTLVIVLATLVFERIFARLLALGRGFTERLKP